MKKPVALAVLGILAASGSMFASLSETFTHTIAATPIPFTTAFTLMSFDSTLGTLTGVTITLTDNTSPVLMVANISSDSESFTDGSVSIPFTVSVDGLSLAATATGSVASGIANPGMNYYSVAPFSGSTSTNVSSANFAYFEAPGGTPLSFTAATGRGTYSGTGAAALLFGGDGSTGGTTTVVYSYASTLTPEPALFGSLGFGLLGLVLVARKRFLKQ